jgi:hypothetical protein
MNLSKLTKPSGGGWPHLGFQEPGATPPKGGANPSPLGLQGFLAHDNVALVGELASCLLGTSTGCPRRC